MKAPMDTQTFILLALIGISAGFLSGFVGIGGGVVMVPALVFLLGLSQLTAQGTSLAVLMVPVGVLGVLNYYNKGHVRFNYALVIALCFVAGSFLGSKIALKLDPILVRRIFGGFMLVVALKFILGK